MTVQADTAALAAKLGLKFEFQIVQTYIEYFYASHEKIRIRYKLCAQL